MSVGQIRVSYHKSQDQYGSAVIDWNLDGHSIESIDQIDSPSSLAYL